LHYRAGEALLQPMFSATLPDGSQMHDPRLARRC
jgi:hypothetical protein